MTKCVILDWILDLKKKRRRKKTAIRALAVQLERCRGADCVSVKSLSTLRVSRFPGGVGVGVCGERRCQRFAWECVCVERREQVRWNVHSGESWVRGMQMSTVRCTNVPVG